MNVFELFAVLTLNKDDYEKGLDDTEKKSQKWTDKIHDLMANKAVASFTLVAKAIIDVTKKLNQLMMQSVAYADQMGDLSAQLGITTESMSEISYMASQWSTTTESMTNAMSQLYMRAKQDGDAFKQLGISVQDNEGNFKSMDTLFYETVGALNSLNDENAKSSYMLDLFGRSAMKNGEFLRKTTEEIEAMKQQARDMGAVVSQSTADFAGSINDKIASLKQAGQGVFASLVAGEPDAEEKLQNFFDNVTEMLDEYIPTFVNFAVRLLTQAFIALIKISPKMTGILLDAIIDTIFSIDWLQVGIDIGKAIAEGLINTIISALNLVLGVFGVKIPTVDFGVGDNIYDTNTDAMEEYEISEKIQQDFNIKIEASGDTAVSQESAEKTAEALAPYIDKILGGK